jgi:hypothetical protein
MILSEKLVVKEEIMYRLTLWNKGTPPTPAQKSYAGSVYPPPILI